MRYLFFLIAIFLVGCAGAVPSDLGVKEGKLSPCPQRPSCVASQSSDEDHQIDPLQASITEIKKVISQMERVKIVAETDTYLHAEFTSRIMRFIDDVEFYMDPDQADGRPQVTQVRSVSRIGYSDWGVNRDRVEQIRAALK